MKFDCIDRFPAFLDSNYTSWIAGSQMYIVPLDPSIDISGRTWNNTPKYLSGAINFTALGGSHDANIGIYGLPVIDNKCTFMIGTYFDGNLNLLSLNMASTHPFSEA